MHVNRTIALSVAIIGSGAIYGVFSMPPLTSSGGSGASGVNQARFEQAVKQEYNYCRQNSTSPDCACFAQKSSVVLTAEEERVRGLIYADRQQLARGQAQKGC